jgi:cytochrome c oxidase assembly protein subunit 11
MSNSRNTKTAGWLALIAILMFGFGYALVPIYNVFCEMTGLNGKTKAVPVSAADGIAVDMGREITVEFDANVNGVLPWSFSPATRKITVRPGRVYETSFLVKNLTDDWITGQAVPSVAPGEAAQYFNKTVCFCFAQQTLGPHEEKQMPVRFIVDPGMPVHIRWLTLSYTFFKSPVPVSAPDGNIAGRI